mgnify:FL=1
MKAKPKTTKKPVAKKVPSAPLTAAGCFAFSATPEQLAYGTSVDKAWNDAELARNVALIKKEDALLAAEALPVVDRDPAISTIVREYDADVDRANRAEQYARAKAYVAMRAAQDAAK